MNAASTLNRGDTAILDGLVYTLRACGADWIAAAAPRAPGETRRRLDLGVDEVVPMIVDPLRAPRWVRSSYASLAMWVIWAIARLTLQARLAPRRSPAIAAYLDADVVVAAGGGYLGGGRPGANVLNALAIAFARLMGRPVLVAPVTVKPTSRSVALILEVGLARAHVFCRDLPTIQRLAALGIPASFASDLAFRSPSIAREVARGRVDHDGLVVAWAPRQFGADHDAYRNRDVLERRTVDALVDLVRADGARVVLVPQSNVPGLEDDLVVIRRALAMLPEDVRTSVDVLPPADSIESAVRQYSSVDALLASRMHAGIFALASGTPCLVLGYEAKVKGVFDLLGLSDWVVDPDSPPTAEALAGWVRDAVTPRQKGRIEPALERARQGYAALDAAMTRMLRP